LIEFNFKTRNPREVNWYLREYVGCVKTTQDGKNYTFEGADPQKAAIYIPRAELFPISKWSVEKKREEAIRRSLKLLPEETAHVIEAMLTPEALAIMGAATAVFAVSHFVGIGEIIDLILNGARANQLITIISNKSDKIADKIMNELSRGITVYNALGGYTNMPRTVLSTVVARKQVPVVQKLIAQVDRKAFVMISDIDQCYGEGFARLPRHGLNVPDSRPSSDGF
jgi:uncharacterized protein YebE (UPF0316 family)